MAKSMMQSQAEIVESQTTLLLQSSKNSEATSVDTKPKPLPFVAPPRASIKIVREPIETAVESLERELELLGHSLQAQHAKVPEALHVVALLKAQTRKFSEAQSLWQECIRLDSKKELYYINLASTAMEQGNDELALTTLRKAFEQGFDSLDVSHHFAIALSKKGLYEESVSTVEKTLKKYPNAASQWLILGQSQLELGKLSEAEASMRRAMELGISSPSVYVGLGNACVRQGKRDEGNQFLRTYAELMSRDKLSGQERYQTLSNQEIKRTAIHVFTEAATFYFRAKDIRQTERLLSRCVAIDPSSANGLRALADLYFKTKKLAEERLVRERIVELGSTRFSDYLDLAKVCAQMEDREQAEANLKLAINVLPNSIEPIAALAQMLSESERLDDARWYAQQSLELEPSAAGFRFLASICKKQKDSQGESEALQYAIQLESKK